MSTIYTESDLIADRSYKVQDVSQIRDAKRFIGLSALFKQVSNTTASVRITSTMQYVPVRCLIFVKGFVAKSVQAKNAEGFAIIAQNGLGIPVGRAYLNPTSVTDTHAVFDIEGKEVKLPLDILCSLVRIKEKKSKEVKKIEKSTEKDGVPPELISLLDQPGNREPITTIPAFVTKLLPNLNLEDIRDIVNHEEDVYSDFDGNPHATMAEADKANEVIRYKRLAAKALKMINKQAELQFTEILNKEVLSRSK